MSTEEKEHQPARLNATRYPSGDPWDKFIFWAKRFYEWEGFDENEREKKIQVIKNFRRAQDALFSGSDEWLLLLKKAFEPPNNLHNLAPGQHQDRFLNWCEAEPHTAREALRALWQHAGGSVTKRMRAFLEQLPRESIGGPGERINLASLLVMAGGDPGLFPVYRASSVKKGFELTEYPEPAGDEAATYNTWLEFLDRIKQEASARGLTVQDRLDAQGLLWCVTQYGREDEPVRQWPEHQRQAFLQYRGDLPPEDSDGWLGDLAEELLLDVRYLARIELLLQAKRQVIFYGPPGTGKTFVARRLAQYLAGSPARVETVQFHPSYAYEDFVEGYRPRMIGRQSTFSLVDGPLKRIAAVARAYPDELCILVVDEINRGNVAKVFGELYYLLEYRDERIKLQYSDEPFQLPRNLWIVGTMNSADRSIALIDTALRRRFYFVGFFLDEPPIKGLLHGWLRRHKPDLLWVAEVVDTANARLGSRHAAIGPSYFMTDKLSEDWVHLIWEHSVLPYLEEHFFGEEDQLKQFALDVIRGQAVDAGKADEAIDQDDA